MDQKRAMIVEDEAISAMVLKCYLQNNGFSVVCIADEGALAINYAKEFAPNIIIMDIFLKNHITGIEAVREIYKLNSNVKIIYITASIDKDTLADAKLTNPIGIIQKPYTEDRLIKELIKI